MPEPRRRGWELGCGLPRRGEHHHGEAGSGGEPLTPGEEIGTMEQQGWRGVYAYISALRTCVLQTYIYSLCIYVLLCVFVFRHMCICLEAEVMALTSLTFCVYIYDTI